MDRKNPFLQLTLPRVKEMLIRLKRSIWLREGGIDSTLLGNPEPTEGEPFRKLTYRLKPEIRREGLWLAW